MATTTANLMFMYEEMYYGITLDTWVQNTHKYNCEINKWNYCPLKKGSFGYDNLAVSIGYALQNYKNNLTMLAELIHEGWCMNYLYWRDNKPYETNEYYIAPYSPLGDERRNMCACTSYCDLPNDEKDKDIIIAQFLQKQVITPTEKKNETKIY